MTYETNHKVRAWVLPALATSSAFVLALSLGATARAQQAGTQAGPAASEGGLEEIVVTARRRKEDLQQTPLAVTAFSAAAIEARGMQTVADVTNFTPNVQFDSSAAEAGGGGSTSIAIRGIGQTDYVLTVEPAVGLYLDGVYIGKSIGSLLDLVDIDNIQVLRGPQGTLFGRNTLAGAVVLTSKPPSTTPEFSLEAGGGSYGRVDLKAIASGPITDRLRVRGSIAYFRRDGYQDRITPEGQDIGQTQGGKRSVTGRVVADYDVSENLLATLSFDGSHERDQSPASTLVRASEDQAFASLYNMSVPGGVCLPAAGASRFAKPYCFNTQYVGSLDSLKTTASGANISATDIWGTSLVLNWKLDDVTLKSITAYRHVNADTQLELTDTPYYYNEIGQSINYGEFSEELQATGTALNDKLKYVAGFYYLKEDGTEVFPVNLALVQFVSGGKIANESFAGFGQATYDLTDQLSFTAGLRYTVDEKSFNPALQHMVGYEFNHLLPVPDFVNPLVGAFGPPGLPLFPAGWYSRNSYSFTPSASITYKLTDEINAYFNYSNGFKGGGFVMRYFPAIIPAPGVNPNSLVGYAGPEKAELYEIGLKSELLQRRLRLNLAAFRTDYTNIQTTFNVASPGVGGNFVPVLANAGDAILQGVELESNVIATDWLRLDASVGYLDAYYTSFTELARQNYPGVDMLKIPNAPTWTVSLGATADLFDDERGHGAIRVDYAYRTSEYKEFSNDPTLKQGAYGLLNATLTYEAPDGHWSGAFGATNLTNKIHIVSGVSNTGIGYALADISEPREFFFKVKYKY